MDINFWLDEELSRIIEEEKERQRFMMYFSGFITCVPSRDSFMYGQSITYNDVRRREW